jgi:hypothetical protein
MCGSGLCKLRLKILVFRHAFRLFAAARNQGGGNETQH